MKILFVEATQDLGGARFSSVELALNLKSFHEINFVDIHGSCQPFLQYCSSSGINLKVISKREQPVIIKSSSIYLYIYNILKFFLNYLSIRKDINNYLAVNKPDIIIVNNVKVLFYISYSRHSSRILFYFRGWGIRSQFSFIDRFLIKRNVSNYITVSESSRQALFNSGIADLNKIYVVHTAVKEDLFSSNRVINYNKNNAFTILHSGGFIPEKGVHISVEVAKKLDETGLNFKLIIAGFIYSESRSKKYYQEILELIKQYNLEERIQLIVNNSNIIDYFNSCDVLIHPSSSEGLPRVLLESMALKKPVIANAVGGVTDLIINNYTGFLTNYNNVNDYVMYIQKLHEDKKLYSDIINRAYDLVKNEFNVKNQIESFNKAIFEL